MSLEAWHPRKPLVPTRNSEELTFVVEQPLATVHQLFHDQTVERTAQMQKRVPYLDDREFHTLYYTTQGHKMKDVARRTGTSIYNHPTLKSVYEKYNVETATQAVGVAITNGALKRSMFPPTDFNLSLLKGFSASELAILRESAAGTTKEESSDAAVAGRVDMPVADVKKAVNHIYNAIGTVSRPKAVALYLFGVQAGVVQDPSVQFVDARPIPRRIRQLPPEPQGWRPGR